VRIWLSEALLTPLLLLMLGGWGVIGGVAERERGREGERERGRGRGQRRGGWAGGTERSAG